MGKGDSKTTGGRRNGGGDGGGGGRALGRRCFLCFSILLVACVFLFVSLTHPRDRRCFCCVFFLFVLRPIPTRCSRVFSCCVSNPFSLPPVLFVAYSVPLHIPRGRRFFWFCFSNSLVDRRCFSVLFLKPFILVAAAYALVQLCLLLPVTHRPAISVSQLTPSHLPPASYLSCFLLATGDVEPQAAARRINEIFAQCGT